MKTQKLDSKYYFRLKKRRHGENISGAHRRPPVTSSVQTSQYQTSPLSSVETTTASTVTPSRAGCMRSPQKIIRDTRWSESYCRVRWNLLTYFQ